MTGHGDFNYKGAVSGRRAHPTTPPVPACEYITITNSEGTMHEQIVVDEPSALPASESWDGVVRYCPPDLEKLVRQKRASAQRDLEAALKMIRDPYEPEPMTPGNVPRDIAALCRSAGAVLEDLAVRLWRLQELADELAKAPAQAEM